MSEEATSIETPRESATESTEGQPIATSFLDGKYESVSALEAGYKELQSTFSKKTSEYSTAMGGQTGAPEAYEFSEGMTMSDKMQEYAREHNYSNEALNGLAEAYSEDQTSQRDAYIEEQKELLGKDGQQRIKNVIDWGKANLGEDSFGALDKMIDSAAGIEIFEKIAKMGQGTQAARVTTPSATIDRDSLNAMRYAKDRYGERRMSSDPQYRAEVQSKMEAFVEQGGKL